MPRSPARSHRRRGVKLCRGCLGPSTARAVGSHKALDFGFHVGHIVAEPIWQERLVGVVVPEYAPVQR
jgi:hypothetical protein